jgi:hypothetical protein
VITPNATKTPTNQFDHRRLLQTTPRPGLITGFHCTNHPIAHLIISDRCTRRPPRGLITGVYYKTHPPPTLIAGLHGNDNTLASLITVVDCTRRTAQA